MMYVRVRSSGVRSLSFTHVPLTPPVSSKASSPSPRFLIVQPKMLRKIGGRFGLIRGDLQITDFTVGQRCSYVTQ